jgi:stearoyl-CoA desaturase (delta-9 desaturase)
MSSPATPTPRLAYPKTVTGQWLPIYVLPILGLHVLALLAFVPWFFSWTGLIVMLLGVHFYGCLGINLCYHRLLAHRSLRLPKWLEHGLVLFAQCSLQDTPVKWVVNHRMHHLYSDEQEDPHSPLVNFFWSHFDWLMKFNSATRNISAYQKYARDLLEDPFYFFLEKNYVAPVIYLVHTLIYFVAGFIAGYVSTGDWWAATQFGLSLFIWGAILRTVIVWHITWSVNSLTHMFGYRTYETSDSSRNNWVVALLASGEGWHNNHHHDQAAASVWHKWWEFDTCYCYIALLQALGLATHVIPPAHKRRRTVVASSEPKPAPALSSTPAPALGSPAPAPVPTTVD